MNDKFFYYGPAVKLQMAEIIAVDTVYGCSNCKSIQTGQFCFKCGKKLKLYKKTRKTFEVLKWDSKADDYYGEFQEIEKNFNLKENECYLVSRDPRFYLDYGKMIDKLECDYYKELFDKTVSMFSEFFHDKVKIIESSIIAAAWIKC